MWEESSSEQGVKYYYENSKYRKILFSPLKRTGFVPEKGSEIYVSNIPEDASIYDLAKFFERAGQVFQVRLMMRSNNKQNRGFGYVTYVKKEFASRAIGHLKEVPFFANIVLNMQKSVDNCRIFLGGVPLNKTKDEIWHELISAYKINNVVDVITYRSYGNPSFNRGFVFLEFRTHEEASYFRAKFSGKLILWGKSILVDWSIPVMEPDEEEMANVKIIYLRNLNVTQTSEDFNRKINQLIHRSKVDKIYKFKDYSYIHLKTRKDAEWLMDILKKYYKHTDVEITWAKPPNKFNDPQYRQKTLLTRRNCFNEEAIFEYRLPTGQPSTSTSAYRISQAEPQAWKLLEDSQNTDYYTELLLKEFPPLPAKRLDLYNEILLKEFCNMTVNRGERLNSDSHDSSSSHQSGSSHEESLNNTQVSNELIPFNDVEPFYNMFQHKNLFEFHSEILNKAYNGMNNDLNRAGFDQKPTSSLCIGQENLTFDESFSIEEQLEAKATHMVNTLLKD